MKSALLSVIVMMGIIDQIHGDLALIEYETPAGDIQYLDVTTQNIRCHHTLREGVKVGVRKSGDKMLVFCKD